MKRVLVLSLSVALLPWAVAFAQAPTSTAPPPKAAPSAAAQAKSAAPAGNLESVLSKMDSAAASFKTLEAKMVRDQFSSIVNDHTIQKGTVYFRRTSAGTEMAVNIPEPANERQYVLFTDSKLQIYQPNIDQVTEYDTGKNREAVQSFLVLGFGGRGHELQKSFDVKYGGTESVNGVNAAKLELTPKAARVKAMFSQIVLWIDPARGISVQQKFIQPESGDYSTATYSDIKVNQSISDDVFKLKTTGKTKVVHPQG